MRDDYTIHDADTENLHRRAGKLQTSEYDGPMTPLLTKEQQAKLDAWYETEKAKRDVPWEEWQAKMMAFANS